MIIDTARKQFIAKTGATGVVLEAFGSVYRELTTPRPNGDGFTEEDALSLLCEWYEAAKRMSPDEFTPLRIVETYRRPRVWATFLGWENRK